ncbi:hypothetical protein [Pseudonocardia sp. MH-G8]|uniref:hypothetical protein n=1 Tax=Pseudonocardia sp. MH-G8 TaxID=1854588 RepID=UPI0018EA3027|nr:hypothetical protein [Pseudonocardia sp. MH-G8]
MRERPDWPALRERLRGEHREIYAALAAGRIDAHIRAFHGVVPARSAVADRSAREADPQS